jgi:hypothetical protein
LLGVWWAFFEFEARKYHFLHSEHEIRFKICGKIALFRVYLRLVGEEKKRFGDTTHAFL